MRLNSKVTWGLAWAGLALVVAVPSADFITGKLGGGNTAAVITSSTDAVKTSSVTTTVTDQGVLITPVSKSGKPADVAATNDPVDALLQKGKKLPAYITDGGTTEPAVPAAKAALPVSAEPTQVASIDPAPVAPTPFPSWARPVARMPAPAVVSPKVTEPVIVNEQALVMPNGTIQSGPVPPEPIVAEPGSEDDITLRDYLERRGLLDGTTPPRSSASVTTVDRPSGNYDPDGFYLSDGPNSDRDRRRARLRQLFDEQSDNGDTADFTLF